MADLQEIFLKMDNAKSFEIMPQFRQLICDPLYSVGCLWAQLNKDYPVNEAEHKQVRFINFIRHIILIYDCGLMTEAQILWQFFHKRTQKLQLAHGKLSTLEKASKLTMSQFHAKRDPNSVTAYNTSAAFAKS